MARSEGNAPVGRPMVPAGSRVIIVVSRGPAPTAPANYTTVPELLGVQQGDALERVQNAGLEVRVFSDYSDRAARGRVVGQLPVAGSSLPEGATQVLLVSSGRAEETALVPLPDVVGRPEAEALDVLQRGQLSAQVVHDHSPTTPAGIVMGQLPDPATVAAAEPIRSGPPPWVWILAGLALLAIAALLFLLFGRQVAVPDITGKPVAEATQQLTEAGLAVGSTTATESPDTEKGAVVAQSPEPGTRVRRGTAVDIVVAGGVPNVEVPDVVGETRADAEKELEDAGLEVRVTEAPSSTIKKGQVVQQTPVGGQSVPRGTTVGLIVSTGPQVENVSVPNVIGLSGQDAEAALEEAGLRVATADNPSAEVAEGLVMTQLPAAGDSVAQGTTVGITVSSGPPSGGATVEVPDVVGSPIAEAQTAIAGAGFNSMPVAVSGSGQPQNEIISQTPEGGERVPAGTTIVIFYSSGQ